LSSSSSPFKGASPASRRGNQVEHPEEIPPNGGNCGDQHLKNYKSK
jgi:hypothetical protein